MKKTAKVVLCILLAIVILLTTSYCLLRSAKVQTYLTQAIASYLSEKLHAKISIGGVNIEFIKKVVLEDVYVEDLHQDTLLYVNKLKADIISINTKKQEVELDKIILEQCYFNLVQYENEDDLNIQFIIDALSSNDTTTTEPWNIKCSGIDIISSGFTYRDYISLKTDSTSKYANLQFSNINTFISDISIIDDTIKAHIEKLALSEGDNFFLTSLSTYAEVSPVKIAAYQLEINTAFSNIRVDASLKFDGYDTLSDFIHSVVIDAKFDTSKVYLGDVAHFAPQLKGFDEYAKFSGKIKGTIDKLKAKGLDVFYGHNTHMNGNFSLTGLPDIDETFMEFNIKTFITSAQDLRSIPLYPFDSGEKLQIPENIDQLGTISFEGEFTGFYNDFVAYGNFNSALGKVHSDIALNHNKNNLIKYQGKLVSPGFSLGKLLGIENILGNISINTNINGKGITKEDAIIELKGIVNTVEFNQYTYQNIEVSGELSNNKFNGAFALNDPNANVKFTGSINFSQQVPEFHFYSDLSNVKLPNLNMINRDTSSTLSAKLDLNFKGNHIDNLYGKINITDIAYSEMGEKIFLPSIILSSIEESGNKKISIRSDIINVDLNGKFTFEGIKSTAGYFLNPYLPSVASILPSSTLMHHQVFEYKISFGEKIIPLSKIFFEDIGIDPKTIINGSYASSTRAFTINAHSPTLTLYGNKLNELQIWGITLKDSLKLSIELNKLAFSETINVRNIKIFTSARQDAIGYTFSWDNHSDTTYSGLLKGLIRVDTAKVYLAASTSTITIADSIWNLNNFTASFDTGRITVNDFKFFKEDAFLKLNGVFSEHPDETCIATLSNFDIQNLNFLLAGTGFKFKGLVNGLASIQSVYTEPNISSSIIIKDFTIDNDILGDFNLRTIWNANAKIIRVDGEINRGEIKTFTINGNYFSDKREDYLDFNIALDKFKLDYLNRFTTDIFSDIKGRATGDIKVNGDFEKPILDGKLLLQKTSFKVDYTNENYNLSDNVYFSDNTISFDSIRVNDSNGNTALASGSITHTYFSDFHFDLHFSLNNFECLNTSYHHNNTFYGTAFASGIMDIKGSPENLVFDVKAKIDKGTKNKTTKISIPIEDEEDIEETNFVTFFNKTVKAAHEEYKVDLSGLQLNFDLEVTPDAEMQIIFDSNTGDIIDATGNGKLKLEINTLGDFSIYGDFIIEEGAYNLSMEEIINKKFKIEKGGSIMWNGDPYQAILDITASYHLRASLYNLNPVEFETNTDKIPVNCNLTLQGRLMSPVISFGIDFPGLEEDVKTRTTPHLSTQQDINKHVFSLLVLGNFMPENGVSAAYAAGAATTTSSELVSKNVSNFLSNKLSGVVEGLDFNYSAGDEHNLSEFRVAFSRQLLNDRVSIQVNGGNVSTTNAEGGTASKIVGDFIGEVKLTKDGRLKGKVYNKSEEQDLLYGNTSYTQGIGIFYRREFDNISDLFKK